MPNLRALCQAYLDGEADPDQVEEAFREARGCTKCDAGGIDHLRGIEVCRAQRTAEWKKKRRSMVTASECAAVLGQNKYDTPQKILMRKLGMTVFKGNKFTQHGQDMEAAAIARYEVETGHTVETFGLMVSPDEPWLGGSPDGITQCGRIVEVKCPVTREIVPGEIPRQYMAQVQQLMHITGLEVADFVEMKGPEEFQIVEVKRDPDWWNTHEKKLREFHARLTECLEDPTLAPKPRRRKKKKPDFDFG